MMKKKSANSRIFGSEGQLLFDSLDFWKKSDFFSIHVYVFSSPLVLKDKVERVFYISMKIKVHIKCISNPTRIDLLVLAQPCEKCMRYQVHWGHIHSHRRVAFQGQEPW